MWRGLLALKCELFIVCLFQGRDNIVSFSFSPFIPTRGVPGRFVDFITLDTEANAMLVCESTMEALLVVRLYLRKLSRCVMHVMGPGDTELRVTRVRILKTYFGTGSGLSQRRI